MIMFVDDEFEYKWVQTIELSMKSTHRYNYSWSSSNRRYEKMHVITILTWLETIGEYFLKHKC